MKKKGLTTAVIAGAVLLLSGCAYQQNYLKKYSKELEAVFGAYESEALGKQNDYGFNGLGEHSYKAWKITYTDAAGEEKVFELRNDENFDFAIGRLYTDYNEDDTIPLKEEQECAAVQSSAGSNEGNES